MSDQDISPAPDQPQEALEYGPTEDFCSVITELYNIILQRLRDLPADSYTAALLTGSEDLLLKKIGEEATEVVMAGKDHDKDHLRYEIADLHYHLLVLMVREGLDLQQLASELSSRFKK